MQYPVSVTCQELIAQLSGFLDGDLDAALREKIERHLATCSDCHTLADTLQKTLALYRRAREDVPRRVHARLFRVLGLVP
jgi:anti-sigma factor (TIGR02949 family)